MLAGPGAISSVMVLVGQVPSIWRWEMGAVLGSIAVTVSCQLPGAGGGGQGTRRCWARRAFVFWCSIMGLLLVALAMQFFVNGLTDLGIISRP